MKLLSYSFGGKTGFGAVVDGGVVALDERLGQRYPTLRDALAAGALDDMRKAAKAAPDLALTDITFLPVIGNPDKILCAGVNYRSHAVETGRDLPPKPSMFARLTNTLIGHQGTMIRPKVSHHFDYEGELTVIDPADRPPPMKTQAEAVLLRIREMVMRGQFAPGMRLMEVDLAKQIGVSRTPVRLALGTLAEEGLLLYEPQRGFVVRGYSIKEVVDAVEVRGRLEGLACRIVAEQGLSRDNARILAENIDRTVALHTARQFDAADVQVWCDLNDEFHGTISRASENDSLLKSLSQIQVIPLAGPRSIAATESDLARVTRVVERAVVMHRLILDALQRRQGDRAEMLMLEHVQQGRDALGDFLRILAERPAEELIGVTRLLSVASNEARPRRARRP